MLVDEQMDLHREDGRPLNKALLRSYCCRFSSYHIADYVRCCLQYSILFKLIIAFDLIWFLLMFTFCSLQKNIPIYFLKTLSLGGKQIYLYFKFWYFLIFYSRSFFVLPLMLGFLPMNKTPCRFPYFLPCLLISLFAVVVSVACFWLPVWF